MRRLALAAVLALGPDAAVPAQEDDGLVPWEPGTLAQMLETQELTGPELARVREESSAYHRRVAERWAELSRRFRTALIEDVLQEPDAAGSHPLAVLAFPRFVRVSKEPAHCKLLDGQGGPELLADLSALSLGRRRALLSSLSDDRGHLMFFLGVLRRTAKGALYLDVDAFEDLGRIPLRTEREAYAILNSTMPFIPAAAEYAHTRARAAAALHDARWPYVHLEKLAADAGRYLNKPVGTIGFPNYGDATPAGPTPVCPIQVQHFGIGVPSIEVLLSKLGRNSRNEVFRGRAFGGALAVRGRVRRAFSGAHYLEAEAVEFVGLASNIQGAIDPGYFDSKRYRDGLARAQASARRAREESDGRWSAPLVEPQDLILSSSAFRGRLVRALGVAYWPYRGPDGWVAQFSYRAYSDPTFAIRLQDTPDERRAAVSTWGEDKPRLILAYGTLRDKDGLGYLDAADFIDAGALPDSVHSLAEALEYSPLKRKPAPESLRRAMTASIEALKREPSRAYVHVEDLVLESARWAGRAVSVAGMAMNPEIDSAMRRFHFSSNYLVGESLAVAMDRLSLPAQRYVLRFIERYRLVILKATVRRAADGGVYLDAESIEDLGPSHGDVGLNEVR